MPEKKSKYDTDPLDPDVVRGTEEMNSEATRDIGRTPNEQARRNPNAEAPTRRIDDAFTQTYPSQTRPAQPPASSAHIAQPYASTPTTQPQQSDSYPSIFVPPPYQPPQTTFGQTGAPPVFNHNAQGALSSRPVAGLNIPEKYAVVLPYAPFYIGLIASIVELLIAPRREVRTRFHAAQGLALQLSILAVSYLFTFVRLFSGSRFGGSLFTAAAFIFLIISMVRVWKGAPHRLAPLNDAAKWLNERIEPRK